MTGHQMLQRVLGGNSGPFALLHRPDALGPDWLEILMGAVENVDTLADIPLPEKTRKAGQPQHDALVLVPHRQIGERGFQAVQDDAPLVVMAVAEQGKIAKADALGDLPNDPIPLGNPGFDIEDTAYADIVRSVLADEIGAGAGSNFVIKRSFVADISDYSLRTALSLFHRLLRTEAGAYWTFIVHTGERTFVGATPERHVSLADGQAVMNPISGTYRYPEDGPNLAKIHRFLSDRKETEELYMVLDEELKMMAQICDGGGQVVGPFLRQMAKLAHTEYYIEGRSALDPRKILKETLLAPTVTGSPLENACRVIAEYEPKGRGYYGGVAALIGRDAQGAPEMDSAILIRTAEFAEQKTGARAKIKVGVGATLVRHSDADEEVAETHTKAAGVLQALKGTTAGNGGPDPIKPKANRIADDPQIQSALAQRNENIADFWLQDPATRASIPSVLYGRRVLVIDAEDNFTAMLALQLRAIGLDVDLRPYNGLFRLTDYDLIVLGPGPGDPRNMGDRRIARMSSLTSLLLSKRIPFMSVCLSHQVLCQHLGLPLGRRDRPNQGTQKQIDLFGTQRRVGFYNSYAANSGSDFIDHANLGTVPVSRDPETGEVHGLNGPFFASMQFHVESVLTEDGPQILMDLLTPMMVSQEAKAL